MFATAVRFLSKKQKAKARKKEANAPNISLDGQQWSGTLREIVKEKGPLTVSSFWEHAQDTGLRSKRQMKMILKWMKGQNHLKLLCNHIGDRSSPTEKIFMYSYVVPRSERLAAAQAEAEAAVEAEATAELDRKEVPVGNHDREKNEPE